MEDKKLLTQSLLEKTEPFFNYISCLTVCPFTGRRSMTILSSNLNFNPMTSNSLYYPTDTEHTRVCPASTQKKSFFGSLKGIYPHGDIINMADMTAARFYAFFDNFSLSNVVSPRSLVKKKLTKRNRKTWLFSLLLADYADRHLPQLTLSISSVFHI